MVDKVKYKQNIYIETYILHFHVIKRLYYLVSFLKENGVIIALNCASAIDCLNEHVVLKYEFYPIFKCGIFILSLIN